MQTGQYFVHISFIQMRTRTFNISYTQTDPYPVYIFSIQRVIYSKYLLHILTHTSCISHILKWSHIQNPSILVGPFFVHLIYWNVYTSKAAQTDPWHAYISYVWMPKHWKFYKQTHPHFVHISYIQMPTHSRVLPCKLIICITHVFKRSYSWNIFHTNWLITYAYLIVSNAHSKYFLHKLTLSYLVFHTNWAIHWV